MSPGFPAKCLLSSILFAWAVLQGYSNFLQTYNLSYYDQRHIAKLKIIMCTLLNCMGQPPTNYVDIEFNIDSSTLVSLDFNNGVLVSKLLVWPFLAASDVLTPVSAYPVRKSP